MNIVGGRLGIIGGGQLGRMLALAAAPLGVQVAVLDPDEHPPAADVARHIRGRLGDREALEALARDSDVVTIEIEPRAVAPVAALASQVVLRPGAEVLATIVDKRLQKEFFLSHGIATAAMCVEDWTPGVLAPSAGVAKLRTGGYDGRGVARVSEGDPFPFSTVAPASSAGASDARSSATFIEERIDIARELAVVGCGFSDGTVVTWDPVEMRFDPQLNLVTHVFVPIHGGAEVANRARAVATRVISELGIVGLLAIELFETPDGRLLVNEVAPRPHNSGHITIETSACSQFEQHIRALFDMPPGDTSRRAAGAMANLVPPPTACEGPSGLDGVDAALSDTAIHLHWYGKRVQRAGRKMGHITAIADSAEDAIDRVQRALDVLTFGGCTG